MYVCVCVCVWWVPSSPGVDLCAGRAVGVDGRLVGFLRLVEAEAVTATVSGAVQLLQQEDHGLVDDAQHPQPVHACEERKGKKNVSARCI